MDYFTFFFHPILELEKLEDVFFFSPMKDTIDNTYMDFPFLILHI